MSQFWQQGTKFITDGAGNFCYQADDPCEETCCGDLVTSWDVVRCGNTYTATYDAACSSSIGNPCWTYTSGTFYVQVTLLDYADARGCTVRVNVIDTSLNSYGCLFYLNNVADCCSVSAETLTNETGYDAYCAAGCSRTIELTANC